MECFINSCVIYMSRSHANFLYIVLVLVHVLSKQDHLQFILQPTWYFLSLPSSPKPLLSRSSIDNIFLSLFDLSTHCWPLQFPWNTLLSWFLIPYSSGFILSLYRPILILLVSSTILKFVAPQHSSCFPSLLPV